MFDYSNTAVFLLNQKVLDRGFRPRDKRVHVDVPFARRGNLPDFGLPFSIRIRVCDSDMKPDSFL